MACGQSENSNYVFFFSSFTLCCTNKKRMILTMAELKVTVLKMSKQSFATIITWYRSQLREPTNFLGRKGGGGMPPEPPRMYWHALHAANLSPPPPHTLWKSYPRPRDVDTVSYVSYTIFFQWCFINEVSGSYRVEVEVIQTEKGMLIIILFIILYLSSGK